MEVSLPSIEIHLYPVLTFQMKAVKALSIGVGDDFKLLMQVMIFPQPF
jgi:hypothetical protein